MFEQTLTPKGSKYNCEQLTDEQRVGISAERKAANQKDTVVQGLKLKIEDGFSRITKPGDRV